MAKLTIENSSDFVQKPKDFNVNIETDSKGITKQGIVTAQMEFQAELTSARMSIDDSTLHGQSWSGAKYKGVVKEGFKTAAECTQTVPNVLSGQKNDITTECHSTTDPSITSETTAKASYIPKPRDKIIESFSR